MRTEISLVLFLIIFLTIECKAQKKYPCKEETLKHYLSKAGNKSATRSERLRYNEAALLILSQYNDSISISNFISVNQNFYDLNMLDALKRSSSMLLQKSIKLDSDFLVGAANRWLGIYYESRSVNDSAFYYYKKSEKIYRALNNQTELCKIYQDQAQVQLYVNDYFGSESSLIKGLKIAKKHNLIKSQFLIYSLLGINSSELQDYKSALRYHFKALRLARQHPTDIKQYNEAISLNSIGYNYSIIGNHRRAIIFYRRALKIEKLFKSMPVIYLMITDNLGNSELKLNRLKEYPSCFFKSDKLRDDLNINIGRNYNKFYLSEYYLSIKDTFKAAQFAKSAYNLSVSFKAPKEILLCLKQLAKVEPKNALKYSQDYIRISDSMHQLERESRNKFAKIAYETEEITNEKEAAVHQKWIFFCAAMLILIIGVLLVITFSQRAKQKEMQFLQGQQKSDEEIYQLIQVQQAKIDEGRSIEKKRIARDLHDGIMNRLASTRLNLHKLSEGNDVSSIKKSLPFIAGIQDIEKEIRNIAHDLNKEIFINTDSFRVIIESLFSEQKKLFKTKCHFEVDKSINWDLIESNKKIHIYRIMQEALNNINKHAHARNIIASIHDRENDVLLEIYDDGVGFSFNEKKKGIGLQNIFSRTKAFNGTVEIKSNQGAGTTLIITIPKKSQIKEPDNGNTG